MRATTFRFIKSNKKITKEIEKLIKIDINDIVKEIYTQLILTLPIRFHFVKRFFFLFL